MKIKGVTHPIPPEYAKRIYKGEKNVFIGKKCLCKVKKGQKFIIYESHEKKAYTGWADINYIGKIEKKLVLKKYGKNLMITKKEFEEYSIGRNEMFVIEFDNFYLFKKPVTPKGYYVTVAGKYIYEDEYERINKNKG